MSQRGVQPSTLQKKCNRWKKVLRLGDWDITCRYATKADMDKIDPEDGKSYYEADTIGCLDSCSVSEKIAVITIRRNYFDHDDHGVSWNIDTLIIHELCHIVEKVGRVQSGLSKVVTKRKDYYNFEEYNCDTVAAIVYFIFFDKI